MRDKQYRYDIKDGEFTSQEQFLAFAKKVQAQLGEEWDAQDDKTMRSHYECDVKFRREGSRAQVNLFYGMDSRADHGEKHLLVYYVSGRRSFRSGSPRKEHRYYKIVKQRDLLAIAKKIEDAEMECLQQLLRESEADLKREREAAAFEKLVRDVKTFDQKLITVEDDYRVDYTRSLGKGDVEVKVHEDETPHVTIKLRRLEEETARKVFEFFTTLD